MFITTAIVILFLSLTNKRITFRPSLLWPNGWMDQDATWYGGRPRPRQHCVRWGPASSLKGTQPFPQFLAHVCCGQTAGWIMMPLGTEVDLGPGHILFDGDPAPPPKRGTAALSSPLWLMSIVAKRLPISANAEHLLWSPYVIGQTIIFSSCSFFLSSIFFFFLA